MLYLPDIWYLFHCWLNLCPTMNKTDFTVMSKCVECRWGKHLTCSLWVNKCCSFCALFTFFLRVSPLKVCGNYVGTKSTFKAAKKLTPSQFCSKNALKLVSAIFYQSFIFHQMIAPRKLWKMFFIFIKKLFSFARYSNCCFSDFPSFSPCQPLL